MCDLYKTLKQFGSEHNRPFQILMVDDEISQQISLGKTLEQDSNLNNLLSLKAVSTAKDTFLAINQEDFDLIFMDIDLSTSEIDGLELIRGIREAGISARICVHSSQSFMDNYRQLTECGADYFIRKPAQLEEIKDQIAMSLAINKSPDKGKFKIFLIEDSPLYRKTWDIQTNLDVQPFNSPDDFIEALDTRRITADQADFIVTDLHFDNSSLSGFDVSNKCKTSNIPVFLSSNAEVSDKDLQDSHVSLKLSKDVKAALNEVHDYIVSGKSQTPTITQENSKSSKSRRHDFMSIIHSLTNLNQFFDMGVYEDEDDRRDIKDGIPSQLKSLNQELKFATADQVKMELILLLKRAILALNDIESLLSGSWPMTPEQVSTVRDSLDQARLGLMEYKSQINAL